MSDLAGLAGEIFWSIQLVAGFGWKTEGSLAKFYAKHLRPELGGSHQPLLRGLVAPTPPAPHAVVSLDPVTPTMGDLQLPWSPPPPERFAALERERTELEARCRAALSSALRKRFDHLLALAQRYAVVRDEQVLDVTLGWPLMRQALRRLRRQLVDMRVLEEAEHVYYLERDEIGRALDGQTLSVDVPSRIRTRERQRRLAPPLMIGKPSKLLVAPTTSPAWTPLFARARAVVTDGRPTAGPHIHMLTVSIWICVTSG